MNIGKNLSEEDRKKGEKLMEEFRQKSVKEAIEINSVSAQFVIDLRNKGFDIESIDDGVQVTIIRAKGTDKEEDFTGFGESVEEAVANAMPIEYTDEQKKKVATRLEAELEKENANLRKLEKDIAKSDANIQNFNEELAKTYGDLARIYRTLVELGL